MRRNARIAKRAQKRGEIELQISYRSGVQEARIRKTRDVMSCRRIHSFSFISRIVSLAPIQLLYFILFSFFYITVAALRHVVARE